MVLRVILTIAVFSVIIINVMFGIENIVFSAGNKHIDSFSYDHYIKNTAEAHGNSFFMKALATIAYPGAKIGRLIHNKAIS